MKENNTPSQICERTPALAHQLWEQDGRQTGRDLEYWLKAEQQLSSAQGRSQTVVADPGTRTSAASPRARLAAKR